MRDNRYGPPSVALAPIDRQLRSDEFVTANVAEGSSSDGREPLRHIVVSPAGAGEAEAVPEEAADVETD